MEQIYRVPRRALAIFGIHVVFHAANRNVNQQFHLETRALINIFMP